MRYRRSTFIALSFVLLLGCRAAAPLAVLTEDKAGRSLIMTAIPESGSRSDVPAGVAARHVVGEIIAPSGAKIVITKKPFHEPEAYMNEQAKAEGFAVVQPKDPWWKWPLLVLVAVGVALVLYFLDSLKRLIFIWRR